MTPHPQAPLAQASDTAPLVLDQPHGAIDLTRALDAAGQRAHTALAAETVSDPAKLRQAAVTELRKVLAEGRDLIARELGAAPFEARRITRAYAHLTDIVVRIAFALARDRLHPNPLPTDAERLSLLAVGGYGRNEMAPFSDVDLLFLTPYKLTGWAESVIESTLYMLWDLKLKVGHSSRTIRDCMKLGREDITIRTSLLEMRVIDGDLATAQELQDTLRTQLFQQTTSQFTEAKLEERDKRHNRQGGQRYVVEPNVKEGKGGLRDLQTLYWIAKYIHSVDNAADLVALKVFRQEEFDAFDQAETYLWAVRCHLHLIAGRAQDQLTFDLQVEVAARMGYNDTDGRRAVEHFMQDYFRQATRVGELTRIFLTALEAAHVKREPSLFTLFRGRAPRRKKVKDGYVVEQNRLNIAAPEDFFADKLNMLRLFAEAIRTGYLLHPDAMREISARLDIIDDEMRAAPEANKLFLDIMLKYGNPERPLRRMNELGVLAAFIPEFAPIVAMMQFNMYHSYTVDEHTIQVISTLDRIERKELIEELPVASRILEQGVNRRVLFVACLIHDLGKGRPEDHSVLGAQIARRLCPRL
ncbi:MAG: [protein-PII] uridylyltransferase, partial [Pseudomonadota bacterium]